MNISLTAFVQNAALLLAVAVVFDVGLDRTRSRAGRPATSRTAQAVMGAILAVVGVSIMLSPFQFAPGLFFDTRVVLLTVSGLFFGPVASSVPLAAMIAFRVLQGGVGAPSAVAVLVTAWLVGVTWRHLRGRSLEDLTLRDLLVFGVAANAIAVTVTAAALAITLPRETAGPAISAIVVPLLVIDPVATVLLGGLLVNRLRAQRLVEQNLRLQATVTAQLADVRASRARLVAAGDEERKRVERDLHDGAQQRLVGLALALRLARSRLGERVDPAVAETLEQASEEAKAALAELRELARGIHPQILTDAGLGPAIDSLARRASLPVQVDVDVRRLAPVVESTAYFVVSEALANVAKYAAATRAAVRIREQADRLVVEVVDDGRGGADPAAGSGLRGLEDRLAAVDGTLDVHSPAGAGTRVVARIPVGSGADGGAGAEAAARPAR